MHKSPRILAWELACQLNAIGGHPLLESDMTHEQRIALKRLQQDQAVVDQLLNLEHAACPCCGCMEGEVEHQDGQLMHLCNECGPFSLPEEAQRGWQMKPDWIERNIRQAMSLDTKYQARLAPDIVRLGTYKRHPVILAPKLATLRLFPDLLDMARIKPHDEPWFFTCREPGTFDPHVLTRNGYWWPLEDRFVLRGGTLSFIPPGDKSAFVSPKPIEPTYGPFSHDFCWVFLNDSPEEPVQLLEAQSSVFKALWFFKGIPVSAEELMNKAGLDSPRPIEVFKIKTKNRGDPRYERQKLAYEQLVSVQRRSGLYSMQCAAEEAFC